MWFITEQSWPTPLRGTNSDKPGGRQRDPSWILQAPTHGSNARHPPAIHPLGKERLILNHHPGGADAGADLANLRLPPHLPPAAGQAFDQLLFKDLQKATQNISLLLTSINF